jgi:hypothetical protein
MWEPRRLTSLWAFTACYKDSFIFSPLPLSSLSICISDQTWGFLNTITQAERVSTNMNPRYNIHWLRNPTPDTNILRQVNIFVIATLLHNGMQYSCGIITLHFQITVEFIEVSVNISCFRNSMPRIILIATYQLLLCIGYLCRVFQTW